MARSRASRVSGVRSAMGTVAGGGHGLSMLAAAGGNVEESGMRARAIRASWAVAAVALIPFVVGGVTSTRAADTQPQTVISGHARFEVLSPTLIRMEYA